MKKYKIDIIEGTKDFVLQEIREKYPSAHISKSAERNIWVESDEELLLLSALKISNSIDNTTQILSKRAWRTEYIPAGINPSLAYCMCIAAQITSDTTVLDPFCGGGTIPITAKLYFNPKKIIASDLSGKAIDKTVINAKNAKIRDEMMIFRSDVKNIKIQKGTIDRIITNLPFGIRVGNHKINEDTYAQFIRKASNLLSEGGLVVALTQEQRLIGEMFNKFDQFKKVEEITVHQGGLQPKIFIYKRLKNI